MSGTAARRHFAERLVVVASALSSAYVACLNLFSWAPSARMLDEKGIRGLKSTYVVQDLLVVPWSVVVRMYVEKEDVTE